MADQRDDGTPQPVGQTPTPEDTTPDTVPEPPSVSEPATQPEPVAPAPPPPPIPPPPPKSTPEPVARTAGDSTPAVQDATEVPSTWNNMWPVLRWVLLVPVWTVLFKVVLSPMLGHSSEDEVVLYRFNKAIYCWPIILIGLIGGALVDRGWANATFMSWAFNLMIVIIFMAAMFDLPRNRFLVVLLTIALVCVTLWLVQSNTSMQPLTWVYNFFIEQNPQFDTGGARILSWLLLPLLIHSVIDARIDGKVRITYNEIEFYKFGDVTDSITRFGKRVKLRIADYLEVVPGFGGGSLVIMNDDGKIMEEVTDLIAIVPRWPRINKILEAWQMRELADPAAKIAQS